MDPIREIQKVKTELETKQEQLASQLRSEFKRFNSGTTLILNSIDEKIAERVQEEVAGAFSKIHALLDNLKTNLGGTKNGVA